MVRTRRTDADAGMQSVARRGGDRVSCGSDRLSHLVIFFIQLGSAGISILYLFSLLCVFSLLPVDNPQE